MEKWTNPETITIWIVIVILFVFLLILSLIRLAYINFKRILETQLKETEIQLEHQKKLLESSIIIQEKERERIAADIHDSLIGKLTSLRLKNQMNFNREEIDQQIEECINDSRRVSHNLYPPMADERSLYEMINTIILPWRKILEIHSINDNRTSDLLCPNTKIQIVRIFQELITNIHKHANATAVLIQLRLTKKYVVLRVNDNGCGFTLSDSSAGLGLQNIRHRILYLDGLYRMRSNGKGTSIIILLNH